MEEAVLNLSECRAYGPFLIAEGGPPPAPGGTGRFGALDAVDEGAHEPNFEAFHLTSADEIEAAVAQVNACAWPCRARGPKGLLASMVQGPCAVSCACFSLRGGVLQGGLLETRRTLLCASIAAGDGPVGAHWCYSFRV